MDNTWYNAFMGRLSEKYPQKNQLAKELMDLLSIERETAYRRLRGEIMFPANELVKIASEWNISLDEVIGIEPHQIVFKVRVLDYTKPSKKELKNLQGVIHKYDALKNIPDLEYLEVCNRMPRSLDTGFPYLCKLQWLERKYQCAKEEELSFSQISFLPEVTDLLSKYYRCIKNLANVSYIWDYMLFDSVICSIRYFHSIDLITDEEKEHIRNDLSALIDYMLEVATKGCWPETGNKVNLYISHINIDTNYSCYYSEASQKYRVRTLMKNELTTENQTIVEDFRNWMQMKKQSSVLISETDEKSRIEFFKKQRQLVDEL